MNLKKYKKEIGVFQIVVGTVVAYTAFQIINLWGSALRELSYEMRMLAAAVLFPFFAWGIICHVVGPMIEYGWRNITKK